MTVVVIGGGFSGAMTAAHLLRAPDGPERVVVVEKSGRPGRGAAYGTEEAGHLLNVPAGDMSAWPGEKDHFERWLRARPEAAGVGEFAPRRLYGAYVEETLRAAAAAALPRRRLEVVADEATSLSAASGGAEVRFVRRAPLRAEKVVLALGNLPPRALRCGERVIAEPWARGALGRVALQDDVLIIGTGLTMVDVVLSLAARNHRGRIWAVSRRGLLPLAHLPKRSAPFDLGVEGLPRSVRGLSVGLRRAARAAAGDWRAVVDGVRPAVQRLWLSLGDAERRRFLRHARPFWEAHRHRVAPEVAAVIDERRASGQLKVVAGRVKSLEALGGGARVVIVRRGNSREEPLDAAWVVNATGPEADLRRAESPLIRDLLAQGLLAPDALGLGADADACGALLDRTGRPSEVLFTLGPWLKGRLWESVAVPELREQAAALAERLVRGSKRPLDTTENRRHTN